MPLSDGEYNVGTDCPWQIVSAVPKLNVGVIFGFTVTVNVAGFAHCPAVGVNVYVPELKGSTTAGLQVPLMPLFDGEYNVGTVPPLQMDKLVPNVNVGVVLGMTVIVIVIGNPQVPASGVNV